MYLSMCSYSVCNRLNKGHAFKSFHSLPMCLGVIYEHIDLQNDGFPSKCRGSIYARWIIAFKHDVQCLSSLHFVGFILSDRSKSSTLSN